jgi:hypothetical protein
MLTLPAVSAGEPGNDLEQCGLAAAAWADDRDELALADGQADAVENGGAPLIDPVALGNGLDMDTKGVRIVVRG